MSTVAMDVTITAARLNLVRWSKIRAKWLARSSFNFNPSNAKKHEEKHKRHSLKRSDEQADKAKAQMRPENKLFIMFYFHFSWWVCEKKRARVCFFRFFFAVSYFVGRLMFAIANESWRWSSWPAMTNFRRFFCFHFLVAKTSTRFNIVKNVFISQVYLISEMKAN